MSGDTARMKEFGMSVSRRIAVAIAAMVVAGFTMSVAPAWADPPPPAPGNGGGNSGQCTGPQEDRPASCVSQGGPGD